MGRALTGFTRCGIRLAEHLTRHLTAGGGSSRAWGCQRGGPHGQPLRDMKRSWRGGGGPHGRLAGRGAGCRLCSRALGRLLRHLSLERFGAKGQRRFHLLWHE